MQKSVLFMGLGYIGLPTAALVADAGLQVTGVDINENVVNNINNCDISNQEPGLQEIVEKNIRNGRLKASLTPSPSDVFLIVVPTPFNEHHQPDISYVTAATRQIIPYLKKGDLYILESTSPVGTTQKMAQLIFSERPELEDQIFIAYCPERILPGKNSNTMTGSSVVIRRNRPERLWRSIPILSAAPYIPLIPLQQKCVS